MLVQCLCLFHWGGARPKTPSLFQAIPSRTRRTPRLHPDPRSRGGWPMWPMWPGRPGQIRGRVLNAAAILQIPCLNSITVVTTCYNYIYIYSNSLQNCYKFGTLSHILARSRSLLMSRFWTIPDSMWNVAPSWMLQVSEEAWPDFSSMLRAIISDFWSFRFLFHIITDHHI